MGIKSQTDNSKKNSKDRAPQLAAYRFKPGQSGNPGGRPKKDVSSEIAQAIFEQNPEKIYAAMGKALLKGNPKAFTALAERAYGKAAQEIGFDAEKPLRVLIEHVGHQGKTSAQAG